MKRNFIWIVLALICAGLIYARFTAFAPAKSLKCVVIADPVSQAQCIADTKGKQ